MYIMITVLKKEEQIKKLISVLLELGLFDSTVLDGEGIENVAALTMPVFSELRNLFGDESEYHKTIITYVQERENIDRFVNICREQGLDFKEEKTGFIIVFPCEMYIGPEE